MTQLDNRADTKRVQYIATVYLLEIRFQAKNCNFFGGGGEGGDGKAVMPKPYARAFSETSV